jgi:hypothetical protein
MRTTVNISDDLLTQTKAMAQSRNQTVGELISEGLRLVLYKKAESKPAPPVRLATFAGNGTCPGVDLDSNATLLDTMEGH